MKIKLDMGLPTILTIIFVTLKLCGVIAWSWWWVFSPILFTLGVSLICCIIVIIIHIIKMHKRGMFK
jgi:hypothetical protein